MALWQWDFWILPKDELQKKLPILPTHLDQDWFESTTHWESVSDVELIDFFDSILPRYETPWAANSQSWGSDQGNRIDLRTKDHIVLDLSIRLDLRKLDIKFLTSIIDFSQSTGFIIYALDDEKLIEPQLDELLMNIQASRKWLFVTDPDKFFADKEYLEAVDRENRRRLDLN